MADKSNGWKPIEDAPKDSTLILLGMWQVDDDEDDFDPYWVTTVGYLEKTKGIMDGYRDYIVYNEFGELMQGGVLFAYWHPLPAPPPAPEEDEL